MFRLTIIRCTLLAAGMVLTAGFASAADSWIEVKSPNFTVVSNAGERTARNVAWQFEQVRGAIEKGWPWAQVKLSRPVTVIAVKDEASMKAMAPEYWEKNKGGQPVSLFVTAADRYYILLRSDVKDDDNAGSNPYRSSYWSYSTLVLNASYGRGLPLWLTNGLAAVLSNSIVRKSEIQFGQPIIEYVREAQGPRLRLEQLLAVDRTSAYYTGELTRPRFDAQSWAFLQYLLFGDNTDGSRLNQAVRLMLEGTPAAAAMQQSYGSIDALEAAYSNYLKAGFFKYSRLQVASDVSAQAYPLRAVPAAESAVARAGFHVAARRPAEALTLISEARKTDAAGVKAYEIEGLLFDAGDKAVEATQAFAKAADLKSDNFYVYYRLARAAYEDKTATAPALAVAEQQLNRAIQLNGGFAPAISLLGSVMVRQNRLADALEQARRATMLEPAEFSHREFVAWVLSRWSRPEEARQAAQQALALARTDEQRQQIQSVLDWIARPSIPAQSAQPRSDASAPAGRSLLPAVNGATDGAASSINAPRRTKQVEPVYPEEARATKAKGTVLLEATIAPDGHVTDATVVGSAPPFDDAALAAVRQWEFEPTIVAGVAVAVKMTVAVNFGYR